ncbi:GNAT family N-acetyltransferase [Luteolibacter marinus]|uniref:GNAT family N-acetyltransferase n=1 Tax=Luteolibacter marinus TaxID=2776705 RepID=UPI0018689836
MIRRYRPGEEDRIWDVYATTTRESNGRDYHPDLIERWAPRNKDRNVWQSRIREKNPFVAVVGEAIVGMAEIDRSGAIDYFYVLPRLQGCGVGSALMAAVQEEARRTGVSTLVADVSVTAKGFFEAMGFTVTETRENVILGHPAPNFAMTKALDAL